MFMFLKKNWKKMNKWYPVVSAVGAVLVLIGAVIQITRLPWAPYVYLAGAVMFAYVQVACGYKGRDFVMRRLRNQQIAGAALLIVSGAAMLLWKRNEWIVFLTIAAVLELYTAFRIPQEEKKERK